MIRSSGQHTLSVLRVSISTVDLSEYNYYFREGFRRGYEDGYFSRSQYGRYSNGSFGILGAILEQILNLQLLN